MNNEELESSQLFKKSRIAIYQYYNDKFGKKTKDLINAYEQEFIVSYEEYMESSSEEFEETEDFGNGKKNIFSILGDSNSDFITSDIIYPNNFGDLSDIILAKLNKNIESFSLVISVGNKLIKFTPKLIAAIFKSFKCINVNLSNNDSWITMPNEINIDKLIIKNTNIIFNNSEYIFQDSYEFDNCVFKRLNSLTVPMISIESLHKGNMSNIYISEPMNIVLAGKYFMDKKDIPNSEINVSNMNVLFSQDKYDDDVKYRSILTVGQAFTVSISDLKSVEDIPHYPLLSIINVGECFINNIVRSVKEVEAKTHTIELKAVNTVKLSDIEYLSPNRTKENTSFFKFSNMKNSSSISVMNFKIVGMSFANLTGIKFDELSLIDGYCSCENFASTGMSKINKIIMDNFKCEVEEFTLDAFDATISDTDIKSIKLIKFINNNSYNINKCNFNCSENIELVFNYNESTFNINDSHINSKSNKIAVDKETIIESNPVKNNLKISKTVITGDIDIDGIYNVVINDSLFDSLAKFIISNVSTMNLISSINYKKAPIEFKATNTHFYNTLYKIANMSRNVKLYFDNCDGSFDVTYIKDCPEENQTNIILDKSAIYLHATSNNKRVVKILSSNNRGSILLGDNNTSISLDMKSKDISLFEYVDKNNNVNSTPDKVYYGKF